ncbi:hypothetical protein [Saccharibacillus sacchari]|uniref:Uncharacterized protein n=1 Tax=Saccharibacillus sacchari TaxID=456493 RepID=A0ACC6PC07_9BACL
MKKVLKKSFVLSLIVFSIFSTGNLLNTTSADSSETQTTPKVEVVYRTTGNGSGIGGW